ncbi:hypothetical protein TBR22_A37990 [Luteitalea sp. TBR-22]|uniref:YIP1 family protein n=1 Tax=Luteitalea sp. TBR-22 TaxID=2802971 RepID=UPI001AF2A94E|nr:YIP1 family protein [Luteitalea sp. TBR-22]BCS34571.1 hypothetical protein TBR22_A37990 [Luteitalea sp. TBR-22]
MSTETSSAAAPPLPFVQRVIGVVVSPGDTMARIAAAPRWVDVLVFTTVLVAAGFAVFLSSDVGKAAYVDQAVASIESFGRTVTPEMYAAIQKQASIAAALQGGTILFFSPLMAAAIAGILYGVFAVLGGEATYKQVLAVVAHAGVISLLQQVFSLPMNYMRQTMSSATNLAVFFPDLAEGSFLASVLGFIDLFWIWYLVVLAIGLAAVYRRRWTSVAGGLFVVYVVMGLAIAAIKAVLGGR